MNNLFWKLFGIFAALFLAVGVGYILISSYSAQKYIQEVNQKINFDVAEHLVQEAKPIKQDTVDKNATHDIMHAMMVINPSIEVYILDPTGKILDYVVPYKTVKRKEVALAPIQSFIKNHKEGIILGDDPKDPEKQNIFSAAPILEGDELKGYAYVILAGVYHQEISATLSESLFLRLGLWWFLLALVGALALGFIVLWLFTKNLQHIMHAVQRFRDGDHSVRIGKKMGNLNSLAVSFDEMADTIVNNIDGIKKVDHLRKELIANVSHDLRTPLAIMQGYVETLKLKGRTLSIEEKDKYLDIILDSSSKLSNLINQLFEYSKLEAREIEPSKEPFQLSDLVHDIAAAYKVKTDNKSIDLIVKTPPNIPPVFADIALVERVILNLLDNAYKFTPEKGSILLVLEGNEKDVEFKIKDSGVGIPLQDQKLIFERFRQAEKKSSSIKGSGLGLAIVKKILEIHNSSIFVKSVPNQGASFWFSLPRYQNS